MEKILSKGDFGSTHISSIIRDLREYDIKEVEATGYQDPTRSDYFLKAVNEMVENSVYAAVMEDNHRPMIVGGLYPNKDVLQGWLLASKRTRRKLLLRLTWFTKVFLDNPNFKKAYDRVEVLTWEKHDISHRWLKSCGFSKKGDIINAITGENFYLYARKCV